MPAKRKLLRCSGNKKGAEAPDHFNSSLLIPSIKALAVPIHRAEAFVKGQPDEYDEEEEPDNTLRHEQHTELEYIVVKRFASYDHIVGQ